MLICALFFVGLPLYGPQLQASREDISFISGNLESEFPKALNLGLMSGSVQNLADFSGFSRDMLAGQNMGLMALWVVTEHQPSGIQVTVGNFMGQTQDLSITIDGNSQNFNVPDNSTQAALFAASENFQISISFPGHSRTSTWVRNKVNLYAFMETARGNDRVIEEIEA